VRVVLDQRELAAPLDRLRKLRGREEHPARQVLWDIEVPLVREDTPAFQEQEALLVPLATKATEVRLVREDSQEQEVNRAALVPTAEMGALVLRARLGREAPSAPEASLVFPVVQVLQALHFKAQLPDCSRDGSA